jgi:hypothetical protein
MSTIATVTGATRGPGRGIARVWRPAKQRYA